MNFEHFSINVIYCEIDIELYSELQSGFFFWLSSRFTKSKNYDNFTIKDPNPCTKRFIDLFKISFHQPNNSNLNYIKRIIDSTEYNIPPLYAKEYSQELFIKNFGPYYRVFFEF
jgi:hypothetical protein